MNNEIKEILDIEKYRNKDGYVENINLLPSEIHKLLDYITNLQEEIERLNNIINRTTKYVQGLSSKGRGCDIYEDIKQEILQELKGSDKK